MRIGFPTGFLAALIWVALPNTVSAQPRRSVIAGTVVSASTSDPIAGARVTLVGLSRWVLTDSLGRFRFDSLKAGTYLLQARGQDDETPMTSVDLADQERVDVEVQLGNPDPNRLPDLVTSVSAPVPPPETTAPDEFTARRKLGIGQFLTRNDIARRHPPSVMDLFRGFRGMEVRCRGGFCVPHVNRTPQRCLPEVILDRGPADAGALRALDRGDVEAIEVYLGVAEAPLEYAGDARCGLILVWTRRGVLKK
jgi:hypothetical protein